MTALLNFLFPAPPAVPVSLADVLAERERRTVPTPAPVARVYRPRVPTARGL